MRNQSMNRKKITNVQINKGMDEQGMHKRINEIKTLYVYEQTNELTNERTNKLIKQTKECTNSKNNNKAKY